MAGRKVLCKRVSLPDRRSEVVTNTHSRDTGLEKPSDLPDVFTSYRKLQEPLRQRPRSALPRPEKASLPRFPDSRSIPSQDSPFVEASSIGDLETRLLAPLKNLIRNPPSYPEDAVSAHPFRGGESSAWDRLNHLIKSGAMTAYGDTRNELMGMDFSTKLSGFLALGCLSARQIHKELLDFENGSNPAYESGEGYGKGENEGTRGVRLELLWRDYMRLCTEKFGHKLFRLAGFREDASYSKAWKTPDKSSAKADQTPSPEEIGKMIERFLGGITGMGLIDASQRELFYTGYTSNRARQNVASFFSKHMGIDWRYGAEWYEMLLIDYDVSSNWSNWQYVAGIGNDPRGDARIFNPVKQAFDYDKDGSYVRTWVTEVRGLEKLENVFQACTASQADLEKCGIADHAMVTDPIKRIEFLVDKKPKAPRKPFSRRRGNDSGGRRGGGAGGGAPTGSNGHAFGSNGSSRPPSDGKVGEHEPNGHQPSVVRSQPPQGLMRNGAPLDPAQNGMMSPNGFAFPPGSGYPQQFGDASWFNSSWISVRGRGYGGGYRGRGGGRRGGSNFNNRGGFGGVQYASYTPAPAPPPPYLSPSEHGPDRAEHGDGQKHHQHQGGI